MTSYKDLDLIGSGGFGQVFRCERVKDGRIFAKKKLAPDAEAAVVRRFVREVRILSQLDHPNIIKVVGKRLETEPYFYVMPLYDRSLRAELARLVGNEERIQVIVSAILDGVGYAHQQGIYHRDLKPENVLLNSDTDIVVSDFGLCRELDASSTRQTHTGEWMGTPYYVAPEQFSDAKRADDRSDIFSIGMMIYELYTGTLSSATDMSLLPSGVSFVVQRCTKRDPARRFQSIVDLKKAWESLSDEADREGENEELQRLGAELSAGGTVDDQKTGRLLEMLTRSSVDSDLLHETLMALGPGVVEIMWLQDADATRAIIHRFVEIAVGQGWGFDYTDRIANQCAMIFKEVDDYQLRASLACAVADVGVGHNRWYVIRVAASLLAQIRDTGGAMAAADQLQQMGPQVVSTLKEYCDIPRLHHLLRKVFS
jgi:eukaryotic-like serine/threonine-protein kinase